MANFLDMKMTIQLANCAGELQVQKSGTVVITLEEVMERYFQMNNLYNKLVNNKDIEKIAEVYRDKKIVFTNGCFDIFHAGHVMNLKKASELGDILIVAINSDESVRRLKGESRPINVLADRMAVIAALESVDYVTWFDEDTPYNLISRLRPDVIVKREDYQNKEVVGNDVLAEYGGQVVFLPFLQGRSTTEIISKIR